MVRAGRVGQALCLAGAALGALGLAAWFAGVPFLTRLVPGQPQMMPNTGLAILLAGLAAALRHDPQPGLARRTGSLAAALIVLAIGAATLAEYALALDLGIDGLIMRTRSGPYPGRPSPLTAFALTTLGAAVVLFNLRPTARTRPSEWLILSAAATALASMMGQIFGAEELYRLTWEPVIGVAVPTAVALLLISTGMLLERPTAGIMRVVTSSGPGGVLLRRVGLLAALGPMIFGLIVTRVLTASGVGALPIVIAGLAAIMMVLGLAQLAIVAARLDRAHRALELSRAQLRDLIEQASDGVFVADLSGRYTDVNRAGCEMLGHSRDEIIGKSITDLLLPEDVDRLRESKERLLQGAIEVDEWMLRRKDGTYLPIEVSAKILPDGRWQGLARDISVRKRLATEQRLLAEVGRLLATTIDYEEPLTKITEMAVSNLADLCVVDIVEENGEVRRFKVAHRDPSKDWLCESLMNIPIDRKRPHLAGETLRTGRPVLMQHLSAEKVASIAQSREYLRLLRATEAQSVVTVPLVAHGKLLGAIALVSSTSSRLYGPDDLRLAQELAQRAAFSIANARLHRTAARAIRARDDVLSIVAHDLRNPLGIVLMQAGLLRRRGARLDQPDKPVEAIERAVGRMDRLIQDLLDVSRMEAGRLSIERVRVSTAQVVAEGVEAQRELALAASLELHLDVAGDVPEVWGDRDRLLQVLENLIGNSVKFTEPGGRVTVGAAPRDGEVLFWVADTGVGIPLEQQPHVFDRFWQARKREHRGAGLGLPIVKGIVEAHGGRVWCESRPGRGSTFFFTIPTAAPAGEWREEPAPV